MNQKKVLRIAALISGLSGIVILIGVFYPIISYNAVYGKNFSELISPISETSGSNLGHIQNPLLPNTTTDSNTSSPDFTQASTWFVGGAKPADFASSKVKFFTISIPRLRIENATVAIGGEDLNNSLVQYPGTALPGRPGNTVVFGHSILPIFYNPKNYIAIFSLLPTLKNGDEIRIDYDGILYKYSVENMFEVGPTDIQVLDQDTSNSFVTLVTCTPPGDPTNPKRLIVRARVIPPAN
jgi:sortase A